MNAELKRRILSDSGIGVPFAQTKILNLNLEYAVTTHVIAPDLDDTLLAPRKTLLPSSIEALTRARETGYQLIIVTGHHRVIIHPSYQTLALDTPAICYDGTYLYDHHVKTVLEADPTPVNKTLQLIEMLNEHHIHGLMYADDAMVYEHPTGHVIRTSNWAQTLPPEQRPTFIQVVSLAETAQQVNAVWKSALTHGDLPRLQHFGKHVEHELELECEWSWHGQVDIARGSNNKGRRLTKWAGAQGWSVENIVAFGNDFNDTSTLEAAGAGVAMGNADDAVKARANIMIDDNTTDSIAQFIYSYPI